jgi:hypothetical protein
LILLGVKKSGKSSSGKRLISSHFPVFNAPSHNRYPHRFKIAEKVANQNQKIKQNCPKACKSAISLRDQLAQKLRKACLNADALPP